MNKKITGTAMVLMGTLYSGLAIAADAPAASGSPITLSVGGEAKMQTIFGGGICAAVATAADVMSRELTTTSSGTITTSLVAIGFAAGSTIGDVTTMTFTADPCGGNKIKSPTTTVDREITFGASGTLANGLSVSFDDKMELHGGETGNSKEFELKFGGAFGEILVRNSGDSPVKDMMAGTTGANPDVVGSTVNGGHKRGTSGFGDINFTYYAPSMGGLDLAIGYAPSSAAPDATAGLYLDNAAFKDTFSIGASYSMAVGDMTVALGGGFENADRTVTNCTSIATDLAAADAATTSAALIDALYETGACGDEANTAIGADITMGDITLSAGYSNMDTDGADQNTLSAGLETSVGDFTYTVGYTQETNTALRKQQGGGKVEDVSRAMSLAAATALGDGVDLEVNFSSSEYDEYAQEMGAGTVTAWRTAVVITVGF